MYMAQHDMSHVTIDIPHCNKDDEDLNELLHDFFGDELVNKPISIRKAGLTAIFQPPRKKRGTPIDFKRRVGVKYHEIIQDPERKKALFNHYEMICSNNRRLAVAEINLKIEEYKQLLNDGVQEKLEEGGFYAFANCLRVVNSYLSATLIDPLPDDFFAIERAETGIRKREDRLKGVTKLVQINKDLFRFLTQYKNHFTTDVTDDQMIEFYMGQIDIARHFFVDETDKKTSGVLFRSEGATVPLLHYITAYPGTPLVDPVVHFNMPEGTSKISMDTVRGVLPTTVYSSETVQVATLPLERLFQPGLYEPALLPSLCLEPAHSYQTGVGIHKNGSTGGPASSIYKKILSELNSAKTTLGPLGGPILQHLIQHLDKVYFFHNRTDRIEEQKAKYLMSLLMFSSGMSTSDLLFSNQYARGNHIKIVGVSYRHTPIRIACWFVLDGHVCVVQLKISFQEFGKDLATILSSDPTKSMGTVLAEGKTFMGPDPTTLNILSKSLFSFGEGDPLFPSMVKYGKPEVFKGGSAVSEPKEDFIHDTLEQAKERMKANLKIIYGDEPTEEETKQMDRFSSILDKHLRMFLEMNKVSKEDFEDFEQNLEHDYIEAFEQPYLSHFESVIPWVVKQLRDFKPVSSPNYDSDSSENFAPGPGISPGLEPDCCEIMLTKEWAMMMEILFLMDKLHDCAETRVKRMGFGEYLKEIHDSLIERIKHKLVRLLTHIHPRFNPNIPFTGNTPDDHPFLFRFCVIVFDFFRKNFKSANYEASILKIMIRSLKRLQCTVDVASESRMLKVIDDLDCAVVNNAVMGSIQTSHPYVYEREEDPAKTVTVCTPGGTYTDGGTVFDKRPVYIKPRNICVSYREGGPYIQMIYKDYSDTDVAMLRDRSDDELIDFFRDFLTVNIKDIETGEWASYPINPMRKVHNKTVLAEELRHKFFSTATPHTDKKALCDFLQHFLPLAFVDCKTCFAVYQNDLMSVLFHMMTMIAIRESGETRTAIDCITAVLYCPKRKLVFHTAGQAEDRPSYHLTCVSECLDDKEEDDADGDVDELEDYVDEVMPAAIVEQEKGPEPSPKTLSGGSTRKAKRKRRVRTQKKQGGAVAVPAGKYPNTLSWVEYETFCYMMDHLQEPYVLYLSLKYKYDKQNEITTLSITDYIDGHRPFDPTHSDNIEMEPFTFRDRAFLYYTFLDLWLDSDNEDFRSFHGSPGDPGSFADIEHINQAIDEEFAFQSFFRNAPTANARERNHVLKQTRLPSLTNTQRSKIHRMSIVGNRTTRNTLKSIARSARVSMIEHRKQKKQNDQELNAYDEAYDRSIQAKEAEYKARILDLDTKRLTDRVKKAIAKRTHMFALQAQSEVVSVRVELGLEELEELEYIYRAAHTKYLENATRGMGQVVLEANSLVSTGPKRKLNSDQDTSPNKTLDMMVASYRLQSKSKQYAEQAWVHAMSRIYIKHVMAERNRIDEIEEDVIKKLEHAIALLGRLKSIEMDAFVTRCEQYKIRMIRLSKKAQELILQSIEYPQYARENTKSLVSILPKAISIQDKVNKFYETVKDAEEYRRTAKPRSKPVSKSPLRYGRRSQEKKVRSQDKLERRPRSKSGSRSRERHSDPGRSRGKIRGLSPLQPEMLPEQ